MNYLKRPYVVTMGTYQMALMLQFERGPRLTREQLRSETLLNDEQFERQLMSLVDAKLLHASGEVYFNYLSNDFICFDFVNLLL